MLNVLNRTTYITVGLILLGLFSQMAFAHGMSDAEKLSIIEGGNLRYMWLGATFYLHEKGSTKDYSDYCYIFQEFSEGFLILAQLGFF